MDSSKFLAKVLGCYFLIVSIAMLSNMEQFMTYVQNLINDNPLMFVTSFFTLIIGLLVVIAHNRWEWSWRVLITIIGWIILLKGISILFYPSIIDKITLSFVQTMQMEYAAAGCNLIFGLILCYFGFRRK